MRIAIALLSVLAAVGCSRPPSTDTFVAAPLPSAFVALHSPNGQRQLLLERFGSRWQGHFDDTFDSTSWIVVADMSDGLFPAFVRPTDPDKPAVDITRWRSIPDRPIVVVDAWSATDPSLRTDGPSAIVSIVRLAGDDPATAAVNTSLAAELEGAVGLVAPPGDPPADPGAVASRVAIEAAARAVIDEDTGTVMPNARMAVLQIPVFLTGRFIAVEHFVFEDRRNPSGKGNGSTLSRFTLHDLQSGKSPDMDELLGLDALDRLASLAAGALPAQGSDRPVAWHPARPGIVLVYHAEPGSEARRIVVPWRDVLPLLATDSPLRAVADSVH